MASAEMKQSAISSLALGAEESFGGRKDAPDDADIEIEVEVEDLDARTQRLSKGGATGGASSGSERGTRQARSRRKIWQVGSRSRQGKGEG